jgi:adenosylcobinamide-GDP ribazoletransferase
MKPVLIAINFLTRLPVPTGHVNDKQLGRSVAFFPVAGVVVAIPVAVIFFFLNGVLPPASAAFVAVAAIVLITGGLHLDGFADVCDGFYAGRTRERILEIMKDSHIGAMGAIGIALLLLGETILLAGLPPLSGAAGLAASIILARWSMSIATSLSPYARPDGTGRAFVDNAGVRELGISTAIAAFLVYALLGSSGIVFAGWALLWTLACRFFIMRRIRGVTGDTLGFICQGAEVTLLVMFAVIIPRISNADWPFLHWFGIMG